jgi:hypothetical protein
MTLRLSFLSELERDLRQRPPVSIPRSVKQFCIRTWTSGVCRTTTEPGGAVTNWNACFFFAVVAGLCSIPTDGAQELRIRPTKTNLTMIGFPLSIQNQAVFFLTYGWHRRGSLKLNENLARNLIFFIIRLDRYIPFFYKVCRLDG